MLRFGHVIVRRLQEAENDIFHILADIASLGQCRRIGNRKRNVENRARGPAISVLPEPVGPMSMTFDLLYSTSDCLASERIRL